MLILMLMLGLYIGHSDCDIGAACQRSGYCSHESYSAWLLKVELCVDGICQCNPEIELRYSSYDLEPRCDGSLHSLKVMFNDCNSTSCKENNECVERNGGIFLKKIKKICVCKDGFLRFGETCREALHQRVLQRCYVPKSGPVYSCDIKANSYCRDGKCICFPNFFGNFSSGNCEPMDDYIEAYNLTKYKVRPNEYCNDDENCIDGLKCKSFKCSCPFPCTYDEEEEVCDCGKLEKPQKDVIGPIIVGIFCSFGIWFFWMKRIQNTIKKYSAKTISNNAGRPTYGAEHGQDSYPLNPLGSTPVPNAASGSRVLTLNDSVRQSPVGPRAALSNDSIPYKPGGDSIGPPPPPQAALYGLNPSLASPINPVSPPSYSEAPSAMDLPPPYSLHPPAMTGSSTALPYPSSPINSAGILPQPPNPSTPLYGLTSTASPCPTSTSGMAAGPVNPSAPYPAATNPSAPYSAATNPSAPYSAATNPSVPSHLSSQSGLPQEEPEITAPPPYNPLYS